MHLPLDTSLIEVILQWQNAGIAVVAMWLLEQVKRVWPKAKASKVGGALLTFAPLVITSGLVWLPIHDPAPLIGERILLGFVLGASSSLVYKLYRRMFRAKLAAPNSSGDAGEK